jgi:hypothetical protein
VTLYDLSLQSYWSAFDPESFCSVNRARQTLLGLLRRDSILPWDCTYRCSLCGTMDGSRERVCLCTVHSWWNRPFGLQSCRYEWSGHMSTCRFCFSRQILGEPVYASGPHVRQVSTLRFHRCRLILIVGRSVAMDWPSSDTVVAPAGHGNMSVQVLCIGWKGQCIGIPGAFHNTICFSSKMAAPAWTTFFSFLR